MNKNNIVHIVLVDDFPYIRILKENEFDEKINNYKGILKTIIYDPEDYNQRLKIIRDVNNYNSLFNSKSKLNSNYKLNCNKYILYRPNNSIYTVEDLSTHSIVYHVKDTEAFYNILPSNIKKFINSRREKDIMLNSYFN